MVPDSVIVAALKGKPCTFAEMRLHVGMRLQVQRASDAAAVKFSTTLIGWVEDGYLIVRTPTANGLTVLLAETEALVIRAFSGIHVHSFLTRVVRNFREPLYYMHLEFPREMRAVAFRAAPRVRVQIPARVTPPGDAAGEIVITDLSVTGAQARAASALANPGDTVEMSFDLGAPASGAPHALKLAARVRNRREGADGAMDFGFEFDALDEEVMLRLQNHVYERMLEGRERRD
ncbi:hypothetical protein BWI17_11625 [Betaproteobacteria bacterium GR16-43]|nr:hypothetical protein BWI17_11625 [Betaproteobacteria bacterium GR16-43]